MKSIAIIGCGAMGGAILSGCLAKGLWHKESVWIKEHDDRASAEKAERYGVNAWHAGLDWSSFDMVLLAVKPNVVESVLCEIGPSKPKRVLSVAVAIPLSFLESHLPAGTEVLRVMPNTPAVVGAGMAALVRGTHGSEAFVEEGVVIFSALGRVAVVSERELDALGALSGCGPGYAYVILDALADAGVRVGLSRQLAMEAAAQTLYGAAKMVLETGEHPAVLRDQVTSPGGTTIAGIQALEEGGLRGTLMKAVLAALAKSDEMSTYER